MSLFTILIIIIVIIIFSILIYARNSGSCKLNKQYPCSTHFCLLSEFKSNLPNRLKRNILEIIETKKEIIKRVEIQTFPEMVGNCALPNKKGGTIATTKINDELPALLDFYTNELCDYISNLLQVKVYPTSLELPTSCALLIYEKEGDYINWHYDYNYYDGRFFTVLIPITDSETCTNFQYMKPDNMIENINLIEGNSIIFEGNYLFHKASKLCDNQKRIILSCQFVTNPNISWLNKLRLKVKDFAYTGQIK